MKKENIIFVALMAVSLNANGQITSSDSAHAQNATKPWDKLTPYEQGIKSSKIKGSRQIAIKPVVQKTGIAKGCVIAYGHYLRPPFVVLNVDHKLLVNDVQVEPSMLLEREAKNAKPIDSKLRAAAQRQIDVSKEIQEKYQAEKEKFWKSDAEVKADVLAFAKSKEVVIDAKWEGNAFMISFVNGTGFEFFTFTPIKVPKGWKQKTNSELRKEGEDSKLKYVRETLESGDCIVFSSNGNLRINDPRNAVNKIMSNGTLSDETKANQLADKVFLGVYDEAFNVLKNYDAGEWSTK